MTRFIFSTVILILSVSDNLVADEDLPRRIDLTNPEEVRQRRPLIIAHRGGVITKQTPECSLAAIRLAAAVGYDMVELDIRESSDHLPVVFHDSQLMEDCGVDKRPDELTLYELSQIYYNNTDQNILTLKQALEECQKLSLGVMYDIKQFSEASLAEVVRLTRHFGYENSVVTINGDPTIQKYLKPVSRIRLLSLEQAQKIVQDSSDNLPLREYFWFGQPKHVPVEKVSYLQAEGALVIPGVNRFRYPGQHHQKLVEQDILKMQKAGVDGFQVDSLYDHLFDKLM